METIIELCNRATPLLTPRRFMAFAFTRCRSRLPTAPSRTATICSSQTGLWKTGRASMCGPCKEQAR